MPKFRNRQCDKCGIIVYTATKSNTCIKCTALIKKDITIQTEKELLNEWGYEYIAGPKYESTGHRMYKVKTPCCGNEWDIRFANLRKLLKNSKKNNTPPPCGTCGPKHRMNTALHGYMEKYARDYNLNDYYDYVKVVRGLSDKMYKTFKHEINPNNHRRGKFLYHLDHIIPIIECFKQGWSVLDAAAPSNLQMLLWNENLSKSSKLL